MIDTTDRYIDIKEVTRKLSIARSTVYLWMSTGKFPQPKRIGLGCSRWLESEVMAYMESRTPAGLPFCLCVLQALLWALVVPDVQL